MKTKLIGGLAIGLIIAFVLVGQSVKAFKEYQYQNISRNMYTSIDAIYNNWNNVNIMYDMHFDMKDQLTSECEKIGQTFDSCKYITAEQRTKFINLENGDLFKLIEYGRDHDLKKKI